MVKTKEKKVIKKKEAKTAVSKEKMKEAGKLAVIKVGGKQYKVKEGQELLIEKQEKKEGEAIVFSEVLLVSQDKKIKIGAPILSEVKVEGKVVSEEKGPKIVIFKMKSKKRYRVKTGHRQKLTKVKIEKIS